MSARFTNELAYSGRELARIKQDIAHADVAVLSASLSERERSAVMRAHIYVWLAAVLERVVRDSIQGCLRELAGLGVPCNQVRASLFALLCDPEIRSISDRTGLSGWPVRVAAFDRLQASEPATFSEEILPLDGRTLRGGHFDTIWQVFGLPGPSLPAPQHRVALTDLAKGRNDVAHGNLEPVVFGKTKATGDLQRLTSRVDEVITHLLNALDEYLHKRQFIR